MLRAPRKNNGQETGNYYNLLGLYKVYIRIMEKKMEATIVYERKWKLL